MKQIEYFYNVIYYFFYRAAIKIFNGIDYILYPFKKLILLIINIPLIRKQYTKRGIDNPEEMINKRTKNINENPRLSLGTMIGAGFSISVILFLYLGIYHIVKYLLFPTFEEGNSYDIIIAAILAYLTDIFLAEDKSVKYIKEFNKKKSWWRTKWKIITILSLFLSLWFSLSTSETGAIGRYLISLNS
ncbi:MAG: hypothetical protein GY932_03970 [Arcobacter sp.]|nr:hypothetical protein [Arcobacter sp.]